MVDDGAVYKFTLDSYGMVATLQTGYQPAKNLQPYHTVEKAFYSRDGAHGLANLSVEAKARYQQRKESYNNLITLLKEYNLHKSIIPVKKNPETTWISFQPAGVKLTVESSTLPNHNNLPEVIHYTELFSYDIVDEVVDHENVYNSMYYNLFGSIKDEKQVQYSTDFGEFHFLNEENTVNLIKLLAQMRDITEANFAAKNVKMSHQDFANILVLTVMQRDGWLWGTPKMWTNYIVKGFNLNEVIFAFNRYNWGEGQTKPIPAKVLKEYMGLPLDWTKKLLEVGQ